MNTSLSYGNDIWCDTLILPGSHVHKQGYDYLMHPLQGDSTVRSILARYKPDHIL